MNANELADELDEAVIKLVANNHFFEAQAVEKAQTMLRQQQAEIAELKHMNRNWQISENILLLELEKLQHCELTDEEITEIWINHVTVASGGALQFARAILKKAQK